MRRLFVLFVASVLLLAVSPAGAEIVERVVAKVNGQIITLSEFAARQLAAAQAAHIDPAEAPAFLRQNNARILQDAIDEMLLLQKAEDAGLKAAPQWVDETIESIRKDNKLSSEEQFQAALQADGLTLSELRQNIEKSMTRQLLVNREVEPKVAVSEAEIKAEYDRLRAKDFTRPPTVTLQEILVKDASGGEARAKDLAAKARAGEDFQALARTHSDAPSRANGGDIGEIAENDMDADLRGRVRALPVGGVSEPMRVEGGCRVVKVVAKTAGSTTPYEAVKERIRERLMRSRLDTAYEGYIQDLRKNAQIELRVREVPLQLTGPIPEASLLEALDPGPGAGSSTAPAPRPTAAAGAKAAPPPAGDDEIRATPQSTAERVAPAGGTSPNPPPKP